MAKQEEQENPVKNLKEADYSNELKNELEELHKFKWSHILWPILSIILISIILLLVYKNFIVKNNSITDRQTPAEKIKTKPEDSPTETKKEAEKSVKTPEAKPAEKKTEPKKVEALSEDYKIKDGDTLGSIAEAKGIGLSQLMAANPGLVAEEIQIGQVIKIPTQ